jgi:hypothetical protein
MRGPYLEINGISSVEPIRDLSNGIVGMSIKNVKIGDPLSVEEWTSHAAMESDVHISAWRQENAVQKTQTSTYHLRKQSINGDWTFVNGETYHLR